MKPTLFLCTLVLAGSAFVSAQSTSPSTPPGSTPPTFPSDQSTRTSPDTPAPAPAQSTDEQKTSNTTSTSTSSSSQTGSADAINTSLEGCLSQASSGGAFSLTDSNGHSFMLQGDTSDLAKHVGEQVRVSGSMTQTSSASSSTAPADKDSSSSMGSAGSASAPASGSAAPEAPKSGASHPGDDMSSSAAASKFFNVNSVSVISANCPAGSQQK